MERPGARQRTRKSFLYSRARDNAAKPSIFEDQTQGQDSQTDACDRPPPEDCTAAPARHHHGPARYCPRDVAGGCRGWDQVHWYRSPAGDDPERRGTNNDSLYHFEGLMDLGQVKDLLHLENDHVMHRA